MKIKYLSISIIAIILDQLTKYIIVSNMSLYQNIVVIDNFFSLFYIRNSGAAFSILEGKMLFFYLITIAGLVLVYYIFKTSKTKLSLIASALLLGGIIGNFIDRLIHQEVIDFLKFTFFGNDFAIFNLADSFISIAVVLLIIDIFVDRKGEKNAN